MIVAIFDSADDMVWLYFAIFGAFSKNGDRF